MAINLKTYPAKPGIIQQLRERKGWGQEYLASQAVISPKTLSGLERGGNARLATLRRIAKALGVEPAAIIAGVDVAPDSAQESTDEPILDVVIRLMKTFSEFDETQDLLVIIKYIADKIRLQGELTVKDVTPGSLKLHLQFSDKADVESLVREFCRLSFTSISMDLIYIKSPLNLAPIIANQLHYGFFSFADDESSAKERQRLFQDLLSEKETAQVLAYGGKFGAYFTVHKTKSNEWIMVMTAGIDSLNTIEV